LFWLNTQNNILNEIIFLISYFDKFIYTTP